MNKIQLTLRSRIYLSMLALILISFVVTGITAFYNFKSQNEEYHKGRFKRKENAVHESMNFFLQGQDGYIHPDSVTHVFNDKIIELSEVHNLYITLFDLGGRTLVSSGPSDYPQEDYPQDKLDYTIFKQLSSGFERAQIEQEYQGKTYILAYWYFYDQDHNPIAITNVRYDKTLVNREELSAFLLNLTYIYLALFVGAAILAFVISNYITKSLQGIGKSMQHIRLGEHNEPIKWNSKDEIGALVSEYNRMLREVEQSAKQLAKSERESAWREMAKQVAHEIKNPLTPMKLRIQHLQRAWEDKAPDFETKLSETTNSVIQQIDTLTLIANEFSNFAQMPKANRQQLDLEELVQKSLDVFKEQENIQFAFVSHLTDKARIMADKDQLIRVFNNLITNASQAIGDKEDGAIEVTLKDYNGMVIVEVKDNGCGISEDQKNNIFFPNFTTKSTGMGLGLAMVKSIMVNSGGDVWFKSKLGEGTSFFVSFPKLSVGL